MAVIGKIRERSSLLLIVIGGALMAFVLTDLLSSGSSILGDDLEFIGRIDGKDIRGIEFNDRYELEMENFKSRENTSEVPEFVQNQLRDQIWDQYLTDYILKAQLDGLGITVSTEELADMAYGDNPHPQVRQAFTNPNTGQFNKNDVINFLKTMEQDETGKTKQQWLVFERAMKKERAANKYNTMISKGLYSTNFEAEQFYIGQHKRMGISYIIKRYAEVADSSVSVDESEIEKYYNENQDKFMENKSRTIEYALFRVSPSSEDTAAIQLWVNETFEQFVLTSDDSNFVNSTSDNEFDYRYYSKNDNALAFDTFLFSMDTAGYMVEPYIDGDNFKMMKISNIKYAPDSVHARHILLSTDKSNKEEIMTRIDSIKVAIESGTDFETMVSQYSLDPGSKEKGGDLGFFKEGFMIPVINDSCFNGELNKLMIIESAFGIHLLEVTEKSPVVKKLQVAIIERNISASRETMDQQFTAANDLSIEMESTSEMNLLAEKYRAVYNRIEVRESDFVAGDVESSRGLVRWAYSSELNELSEAMQFGGSFVVSKLVEVHEDGVAPLDRVRAEAEIGAIKDKKAESFLNEMQGFTSLKEASEALNLLIERADEIVFEEFSIPGLGREPSVLGKIFTMNLDDLSVPLKGENGVYIIHVVDVKEVPEVPEYVSYGDQLHERRSSRVNFEVFEALKDMVEIEDNRFKFY